LSEMDAILIFWGILQVKTAHSGQEKFEI